MAKYDILSLKVKLHGSTIVFHCLRDAIHIPFVTFIGGKWPIVGGWVKHLADKRDKVGESRLPKILG